MICAVPPSDHAQVIEVTCIDIRCDKVRLGFQANREVTIHREEVQRAIDREEARRAG